MNCMLNHTNHCATPGRRRSGKALLIVLTLVLAGGAIGYAAWTRGGEKPGESPAAAPADEQLAQRQSAYMAAMAGIEAETSWPANGEELVRDFWEAASRKDFDRMTLLCPGAMAKDFEGYYVHFTPSPAHEVGPAERDPQDAELTFYRVKIAFPGMPNKTMKMALRPGPQGRLYIDGQRTVWW